MKILILFVSLVFAVSAYGQTATVISQQANLRGTPSTAGKIVDKVRQNDVVEVIRQRGAWFLVQTDSFAGWLHGDTIRLNDGITFGIADDVDPNYYRPESPTPRPVARQTAAPAQTPQRSNTGSRSGYILGPRGGCYYINSRGNKTYVSRSLCS